MKTLKVIPVKLLRGFWASQGSFFFSRFLPSKGRTSLDTLFALKNTRPHSSISPIKLGMHSKPTHTETRTKSMIHAMFSRGRRSDIADHDNTNMAEWELRPGGMVVQKRNSDVNQNSTPKSTIKIKVKYDSSYHQIQVSPHASFGELKKMLVQPTGLHVQDQKLIYKKRERDSKSYLDVERVKDGSKLVLLVDIESRERRILEMLKTAKKEKTSKSLTEITVEVDKLVMKVAALKAAASTGGVIAELDIETLTENLMRTLIALDEIYAEGELKLQRKEQVRRVQKHIETLDMMKMARKNSISPKNDENMARERQENTKKEQPIKHCDSVVVTTKWETFD
ncbi:BAG family molecular chaperone regulator 1, partial [Mucuna pruriens]